jgi:hypothetical protein
MDLVEQSVPVPVPVPMALDHERFEVYQAAPELFDLIDGKRERERERERDHHLESRTKNHIVKFFTMRPLLAPNF